MQTFNISLIIPTYKRERQVTTIINKLRRQLKKSIKIEVLLCDSFSNYTKKNFNFKKKNFKIYYYNIKKNNLSVKRNFGIKKSKFNNIILLDDDCIPKKNFILNYVRDLKKIDKKTILSGIVEYPKKYILKYNHIKYRNLKHFKSDKNLTYDLPADKIVAMNMAFRKSINFLNAGLFDERFTGYGFEDHEFAFRYKLKGFQLLRSKASIMHDEGKPNINMYAKKYYHLGKDGMGNFLKVNKTLAKNSIYGKIERNFVTKIIVFLPVISLLLFAIERLIIKTDKLLNFKCLFLYDYLRLFAYIRGYIDRKKNKKNNKLNSWYE